MHRLFFWYNDGVTVTPLHATHQRCILGKCTVYFWYNGNVVYSQRIMNRRKSPLNDNESSEMISQAEPLEGGNSEIRSELAVNPAVEPALPDEPPMLETSLAQPAVSVDAVKDKKDGSMKKPKLTIEEVAEELHQILNTADIANPAKGRLYKLLNLLKQG